jgi:hypothetical protein
LGGFRAAFFFALLNLRRAVAVAKKVVDYLQNKRSS